MFYNHNYGDIYKSNCIREEIHSRLNSENSCHNAVQECANIKIKM